MKLTDLFEQEQGDEQYIPFIKQYFGDTKIIFGEDLFKLSSCVDDNGILLFTYKQCNNGSFDGDLYMSWIEFCSELYDTFMINKLGMKFIFHSFYNISPKYVGTWNERQYIFKNRREIEEF